MRARLNEKVRERIERMFLSANYYYDKEILLFSFLLSCFLCLVPHNMSFDVTSWNFLQIYKTFLCHNISRKLCVSISLFICHSCVSCGANFFYYYTFISHFLASFLHLFFFRRLLLFSCLILFSIYSFLQ